MRNIDLDSITRVAAESFDGIADARRRELLQQLVVHLHRYAKEMRLTHDECRAALSFLHRVGDISSESRSEFSLLSDVLGLSSVVDLLASAPGTTPGSVLGPFHAVGSPWRDNPVNLIGNNAGERVVLRGQVTDSTGRPLPEATLDFWQNADNGLYWQMDSSQPPDNLRCQLKVNAGGRFEIATIRPKPYPIPTDGPVWKDLVEPAGRSAMRPAHFHLIVSAPGHRTLVTEVFAATDAYLDTDAVFGVREALVARYEPHDDPALRASIGATVPVPVMSVELRLQPNGEATTGKKS